MKSFKTFGYIAIVVLALFLAAYLYSVFIRPAAYGAGNTIGMMLLDLVLGGLIVFLIIKLLSKKQAEITGTKMEAVRTNLSRARKKVREEYLRLVKG